MVCSYALATQPWPSTSETPLAAAEQTAALGNSLITTFALPFEVASLLLLAALVGAIVLAKSEREPESPKPSMGVSEAIVAEIDEREAVEAGH